MLGAAAIVGMLLAASQPLDFTRGKAFAQTLSGSPLVTA
jgi:hypothetical protein